MAFMTPGAENLVMYHVETEYGTELVREDVCGVLDMCDALTPLETTANLTKLEPYLNGSRIEGVEKHEGWYANLSANGYLDQTDWQGPYETAEEAIAAVCEEYNVDENGDDVEEVET